VYFYVNIKNIIIIRIITVTAWISEIDDHLTFAGYRS